jgi:hypothetical protein
LFKLNLSVITKITSNVFVGNDDYFGKQFKFIPKPKNVIDFNSKFNSIRTFEWNHGIKERYIEGQFKECFQRMFLSRFLLSFSLMIYCPLYIISIQKYFFEICQYGNSHGFTQQYLPLVGFSQYVRPLNHE